MIVKLHGYNFNTQFCGMKITIIGSGNAATVLGKLLVQQGHRIQAVAGRNMEAVSALAKELHAAAATDLSCIRQDSDVYIIAVKDDAVAAVASQLQLQNKLVVHTCGSVPMQVLLPASNRCGVLYPLQSLRKELIYLPAIPFLIDGSDPASLETIRVLASGISGRVIQADDGLRLQYHLVAIIVSNFSNHLFALAEQYAAAHDVEFKMLMPLIEETVQRMHHYAPQQMQTGPAARGDDAVIEKHLQLLQNTPKLKAIYELMTKSIQQTMRR